ncbi:MAG: hypothetical protein LBB42_03195 [Coriobacteriales bacterium]|nr:hypothetical protein [Coriobacteriales bacterium]
MFENDYIMRMIMQLTDAITRSLQRGYADPQKEIEDLENAMADLVDMDAKTLFTLAPESMVSMLQLGSFDAELGGYLVRALYYEADLLEEQGLLGTADLRRAQANAIADTYSIDKDIANAGPEALEEYFAQQDDEQQAHSPLDTFEL